LSISALFHLLLLSNLKILDGLLTYPSMLMRLLIYVGKWHMLQSVWLYSRSKGHAGTMLWIRCQLLRIQTIGETACNYPRTWLVGASNHFYPLVNIQKTMDNHHFSWEKPLYLLPFSIAMLVYQRVCCIAIWWSWLR
jgi:hypothetical protein